MSVIGRLDDQVDEILISPLKRQGKREEEEASEARQAPQEQALTDSAPLKKEVGNEELPVWLL